MLPEPFDIFILVVEFGFVFKVLARQGIITFYPVPFHPGHVIIQAINQKEKIQDLIKIVHISWVLIFLLFRKMEIKYHYR